ncbi:MAG TPA: hypothetical protein PKE14_14210, partial [Chitinophagales bacterium]|nr:hypothetical protein [Chitinophagales bacterium]
CLTLKACPCPDKNINGSFYYDVVTDVTIEGGVIGVVGDHPITGVHDAESYSIGTTEKTIMLDYQTYLKSGKIDITETAELKLQLFAFGKEALIDTIYADSTADTITVYLRLDGYDAVGSNLRTGIGECSSNPIETPYIPYIDPCLQDQIDLAINNAYAAYEQQIIELTESFKEAYIAQCMGNLSEDFTKSFSSSEYHYTLYYYDQAGNLTMTVPPAGVDILDATEMTAMESYRYGGGDEIVPNHTLETRYRYNSLNQLTMQSTPDAGESRFWYDALGRIVLSQNAKQAHVGESGVDQQEFSYTRYDELGRIYEVGELQIDDELITSTYIKAAVIDQASLTSALIAEGTVSEVTSTYYNQPFTLPGSPFGTSGQTNQRNRISAVTIEAEPDTDPDTYDHATHYSYDIHGNVHTLIQDNPSIGEIQAEERFKKVQYTYDLVSGNVMLVAYQDNMADQMYHAYQYDADNRIYEVQSSRDGYIWEKEARYFYYRHGPLARVETGDLIVQGTD